MGVVGIVVATAVIAGAGCGGDKPKPTSCPDVLPASCPDPSPSYAADIEPLLRRRCGACHAPEKIEAAHSFETYDQVRAQSAGIRIQIDSCIMPPADQEQPTAAERQAILEWIVCGAMNN
ncbi:MAG: hypothetical protein ABUL77_04625 [Bacteroidota bacterium]